MDNYLMTSVFHACLLCNSNTLKKLSGYEKDYLVKCKSCGFVFCERIPTYEELQEEYATTYTRSDEISPITLVRYPELLSFFNKYKLNNTIIDVGAGNGHFIKAAKDAGWNAYGTEFEERAVKICSEKGINMQLGKLDPKNYQPAFFDIITSFEVIEHINNPVEEITNFNKILREGGLVYITTPNFSSFSKALLGGKWSVFNYPEHLSYYTPKTLNKLFASLGFKCIRMETMGINYDRLIKSSGYDSKIVTNCSTESLRELSEKKGFWKSAKSTVNTFLNLTRRGDKIRAAFVKVKSI